VVSVLVFPAVAAALARKDPATAVPPPGDEVLPALPAADIPPT
jgi:hypothetical protein